MNAYILVGLTMQQRLVPMLLVNADSLEAAAAKLAGTIVEKNDQRYVGHLQMKLGFGRLVPSIETGRLFMTATTGVVIGGPSGGEFFAEMLANSYPTILLCLLPQI